MEAQGQNDNKRSCPRCFAVNTAAATFCTDCGASLDGTRSSSDSDVSGQIANANVLRMRNQLQEAIDACLAILRRYPNNVTAHSLLGEIYLERDEPDQAVQWFEMALDLDPKNARDQAMLAKAKSQLEAANKKQTIEQLEIQPRSFTTAYVVGVAALILAVGLAAFFIGSATSKNRLAQMKPEASEPIQIPAGKPAQPLGNPATKMSADGKTSSNTDLTALRAIQSTGERGNLITSLLVDPATELVTVTATMAEDEAADVTATRLAWSVFAGRRETRTATIRLTVDRNLVFVGTVSRDAFDEAAAASQPVEALAKVLFPNPWATGAGASGAPVTGNAQQPQNPVTPPVDPQQPPNGTGDPNPGQTTDGSATNGGATGDQTTGGSGSTTSGDPGATNPTPDQAGG
ncbi:MAG: tetratricopeptide repeat protein [Armatimonadetes bacterium]|nr:tetratricopeptide repeat protein [Armatimonadota bacterium]